MAALPSFESLLNGQKLRISELSQDFAFAPVTDNSVGSVKYFLPSGEEILSPLYRLTPEWLQQRHGMIKLRADAFAPGNNEKFLGSCEIKLESDWSEKVTCGPGVTGFYLIDRHGKMMNQYANIRNGQVIRGN